MLYLSFAFQLIIVVSQHYDTDGSKEYVIRGNSAIIKCQIPSFVADFVSVVSWHTDQDETFYADNKYGLFVKISKSYNYDPTYPDIISLTVL